MQGINIICRSCGMLLSKDSFRKEHLSCKKCENLQNKKYKKTKRGVISAIYSHQKKTSIRRQHPQPTYSVHDLFKFALKSDTFNRLYDEWVDSGYDTQKKPTFDRSNDREGYSFDNFNAWMTWEDNNKKANISKINGDYDGTLSRSVVGIHLKTGIQIFFKTMEDAKRFLKTTTSLSYACSGRYKTSMGYMFFYEEEYNNFIFG